MKKVKHLKLYNFIAKLSQLFTIGYIEKEPADYEDLANF
jgi:hypothetical protein